MVWFGSIFNFKIENRTALIDFCPQKKSNFFYFQLIFDFSIRFSWLFSVWFGNEHPYRGLRPVGIEHDPMTLGCTLQRLYCLLPFVLWSCVQGCHSFYLVESCKCLHALAMLLTFENNHSGLWFHKVLQ